MTTTAVHDAYKVIERRFNEHSATAYADHVPQKIGTSTLVSPPYFHFFWTGGGEDNVIVGHHANLVFIVKAVAASFSDAMDMCANLVTWFDDQGTQDLTSGYLTGGDSWTVTATMQETTFHQVVDKTGSTTQEYHDGFYLRLFMER